MKQARQRVGNALAAPQPGTWVALVPWLGLVLLAAAVGLSVCEARTPGLHLSMSFSAGQLLIGPAILAFLAHQALGALWGLVARRGAGPCGLRMALADSALASLHCAVAWLPVLLIPWFLGNVSVAVTLRILLVGCGFGFTLRLAVVLVRARVGTRLPGVAHLPVDLLVAVLAGAGLFAWAPGSFGALTALNPLAAVAPLFVPALSVPWAFGEWTHLATTAPVFASLPVFLLAHLALQAGCVGLLAALRQWDHRALPPGGSHVELGPTRAGLLLLTLLALVSPGQVVASPQIRCAWPLILGGEARFDPDAPAGAVLLQPFGSDAVLLHAQGETEGRLVVSWRVTQPREGSAVVETSRRVHLPAHRAAVVPVGLPESSEAFRAGMPPAMGDLGVSDYTSFGIVLDLSPAPGPPVSLRRGQGEWALSGPRLLPVGLDELRNLLSRGAAATVLVKLSDLARLAEADAALLLDALCSPYRGHRGGRARVVVVDDVPGPVPALAPSARHLLPRRLSEAKAQTGVDYLRALSSSTGSVRDILPEYPAPLTLRCSSEDDAGPLLPVPFRVTVLGLGTCAYVAFDASAAPPGAPADQAGLAAALLVGDEPRASRLAPLGAAAADLLQPFLFDHTILAWPGIPWTSPSLRGGRWAPYAFAGGVLLVAALAHLWLARRRTSGPRFGVGGLAVPLGAVFSLLAGRWLGGLVSPSVHEWDLTWQLPAMERSLTQRVLAVSTPWAGRAAPRAWPEGPAPESRFSAGAFMGIKTPAGDLESGLALAAGTVESVAVTEVAPLQGSISGELTVAADGSVAGTLRNGTAQDLESGLVLLPRVAAFRDQRAPVLLVPRLGAGANLALPATTPLPYAQVPGRLAGTPLAEFWPGLHTLSVRAGSATFLGVVAGPPEARDEPAKPRRSRHLQVIGTRLECGAPPVEQRLSFFRGGVCIGTTEPHTLGGDMNWAVADQAAYLTLVLPQAAAQGALAGSPYYGWRWTDLPAGTTLDLDLRCALLIGPSPTLPIPTAGTPPARLQVALLDVTTGTWQVVAEDVLRSLPEPTSVAGAPKARHALVETDGRQRVVAEGLWCLDQVQPGSAPEPERALHDALDACALHLRLEEARRFVHCPGGLVFVRVSGERGPLEAWAVDITARIAGAVGADDAPKP